MECKPLPEERPTEGKSIEGEPLPEERAAERESMGGKPLPEERPAERESIEGEPLPEERPVEGKSMGGKPLPEEWAMEAKSIAAEREGAGSHETAATSKGGPHKMATAKGRPRKPVTAKAVTAKPVTAKAATAKPAVNGRRAQSRGGHGNRRGGQSSRYVAHHDAPPFVRRRTPAFKCETRQFSPGCSVRHCRSAGGTAGRHKGDWRTEPHADEKTLRHSVPESPRGRDRRSRSIADVPPAPSPRRPYARVAAIGVTVRVAHAEKGKSVSKEPMMEKPIPVPECKSIADKMIAVECGASHPGVTKAAEVAPAEVAPAKAAEVPAKMSPTKAASVAATAAMHGGHT
jgi:hypothetical protein